MFITKKKFEQAINDAVMKAEQDKYIHERYERRIAMLRDDARHYEEKYTKVLLENARTRLDDVYAKGLQKGKLELYEQLLKKLMGERTGATDCYFIFEGKVYRAVEFDLNRSEEGQERLMVEFVKTEPFPEV